MFLRTFLSLLKLRKVDPTRARVYKISGPDWFIRIVCYVPTAILILSLILFFWVPGVEFDKVYFYQVGGGVILSLLIGEILIYKLHKKEYLNAKENLVKI